MDGFPVIREVEEEATEEVSGTLDLNEIDRMAQDDDEEVAEVANEEDEDTIAPSEEHED